MIPKNEPFQPKLKKITKFDVCFDANGNLQAYANSRYWSKTSGSYTEPNAVFDDKLKYDGYFTQGVNSHIYFVSEISGRRLHMFMSDFDEIIRDHRFIDGVVEGKFCFVKRGNSQGVRYFFEPRP